MAKPSNTTSTEWQAQNKSWYLCYLFMFFFKPCFSISNVEWGCTPSLLGEFLQYFHMTPCRLLYQHYSSFCSKGFVLSSKGFFLSSKGFFLSSWAIWPSGKPFRTLSTNQPADAASSTVGLFCTNNGSNNRVGRHVLHLRFYLTRLKRRESYYIAWPLTSRFSKHTYFAISSELSQNAIKSYEKKFTKHNYLPMNFFISVFHKNSFIITGS